MKVGVVGGTGNISRPFVELLVAQGHEVVCFNRGRRGSVPAGARGVVVDRKERSTFEQAVQSERLEAGLDMMCFNAEDAQSDLRAFARVGHLIHCSTVDTYGTNFHWLPVTEDHPLRPISPYGVNKVAADRVFLSAHYREGFPVTIVKPAQTYGPQSGMGRMGPWDSNWIDRIRKGKPILVINEGTALHQFLHVDDAAPAFAHLLGRERCIGQVYNLARRDFVTWADYYRAAMRVLGREVDLVGISLAELARHVDGGMQTARSYFAYNRYYCSSKLCRDVPEFAPRMTLEEGMRRVFTAMEVSGRIPDSDKSDWEDRVIGLVRAGR